MDALTKERRDALNGLITRWISEQDPEGRVLDTFDYFDIDKIDELIDEVIAPAIADAVTVALAARASDAAQAPIYQVLVKGNWTDSTAAEYAAVTNEKRIVYAAPVAPAPLAAAGLTEEQRQEIAFALSFITPTTQHRRRSIAVLRALVDGTHGDKQS